MLLQVKLNLHGVVGVESAQQVEEEEYEETIKVYESAPVKVIPFVTLDLVSRIPFLCRAA